MEQYPYITSYVNEVFTRERNRLDYIFLRPVLLVVYFFVRCVAFPIKFVLHRNPYGFEAKMIDRSLALGLKYLASHDAAELLIRHVQIEPLLYRFILQSGNSAAPDSSASATAGFQIHPPPPQQLKN
jgi:hypothetical protein